MAKDLERVSILRQCGKSSNAPLVRKLGIQLSLYANPNDETSLSNFEDIFKALTEALPDCIPVFENLEELHLHLLGRGDGIHDALPQISDDIPTGYYRSIGKCLSATSLPHLQTLGLDLRSPCDIYAMMEADIEARSNKEKTFLVSNLAQIRSLTLTLNVDMCQGNCRYDCGESYQISYPGSTVTEWTPTAIHQQFEYSLANLEYLDIACTDSINLDLWIFDRTFNAQLRNLRFLCLRHVLIGPRDVLNLLETNKHTLEEVHVLSIVSANPADENAIHRALENMKRLKKARLSTSINDIKYNRN